MSKTKDGGDPHTRGRTRNEIRALLAAERLRREPELRAALEDLVRTHLATVIEHCAKVVGPGDPALEAAHSGLVRLLMLPLVIVDGELVRRLSDGRVEPWEGGPEGAWLRFARRESARARGRAQYPRELSTGLQAVAHRVDRQRLVDPACIATDAAAVDKVLSTLRVVLSPREREALAWRLRDLSVPAVAEAMGVSVSYAEKLLRGVRRRWTHLAGLLQAGVSLLILRSPRGRRRTPRLDAAVTPVISSVGQLAALMAAAMLPTVVGAPQAPAPSTTVRADVATVATSSPPGGPPGPEPRGSVLSAHTTRPASESWVAGSPPALATAAALQPAAETPEDSKLTAAAASDAEGGAVNIVALGVGHSCACTVLFQSADGGATWRASPVPAPPDAIQVVLPPAYPDDSRIFLGSDARAVVGAIYMVPTFGAPALPLPGGPGRVALAADFDGGDARLFVAGRAGVLSVHVGAQPTPPELVLGYLPTGPVASLATPRDGSTSLLILAPPGSVLPGRATAQAPLGEVRTVLACHGLQVTCAPLGDVAPGAVALVTASSGSQTVAVWSSGVGLSNDGGRTFAITPAPPHAALNAGAAFSSGRAWAPAAVGGATTVLSTLGNGEGWQDVGAEHPELRGVTAMVAVPNGRLLALLVDGGLDCTADGGYSWHRRCP